LIQAYGNTWHIAIATSRELCSAVHHDPHHFLDAAFGAYRFILFRHAGMSNDSHYDLLKVGNRIAFVLAAICLVVLLFFKSQFHPECLDELSDCSAEEKGRAHASEAYQFYLSIAIVIFILTASFTRMTRKSLHQKLKFL